MKPCPKNRELIAWLVLGNLEADRACVLRDHLESCGGCRRYFEELSMVTASVRAAEVKTSFKATESFHQRVVARVQARRPSLFQWTLPELVRSLSLSWRVGLSVVGGIAILIGLLFIHPQQPPAHPPGLVRVPAPAGTARDIVNDLEPTISNYQMVANHSLDKLDQLLTEQGSRNLPKVATYTAGTFAIAAAPD